MATLSGETEDTYLRLTPHRVLERGNPTWITALVEVIYDGQSLDRRAVSLTDDDLAALRKDLILLRAGETRGIRFVTTDADFMLAIEATERPHIISVSIWQGEPYGLMRGLRFTANGRSVDEFLTQLASDEAGVESEGGGDPPV